MVRMTVAGLRLGQKVTSIQGRDYGREYLIIGFDGDYHVLAADGVYRKVTKAKKKNLRHVKVSLLVDKKVEERLKAGQGLTDDELQRALENLGERTQEGEVRL